MTPDIKNRLLRVANDPHFSNRERHLARSALQRILELESKITTDWSELARMALLNEAQSKVIDKQSAIKIDRFLKRHRYG